jgi:SAM-dependent methyltransferase
LPTLETVDAADPAACAGLSPPIAPIDPPAMPQVPGPDASATTLAHYDARAEEFRAGTRDHDVSQNIDALLRHIEGTPPFTILDLGCGPGRDLAAFTRLGHVAIGLDGAARFVAMARADTGCEVWHQDFLALELPPARFDGIFANACLFHVPSAALPRVLRQLHATLVPRGVLFSSNPRGEGEEGWSQGRYGAYHDLETWRRHLGAAGFVEIEHYYRPSGRPRAQQPWLASVWRAMPSPAPTR